MSNAANKTGSESKDSNDVPPQPSLDLPPLKNIRAELKDPKDVNLPADILLLTVKDCEFKACYVQLRDTFRCWFDGLGFVFFGQMGEGQEEKLKVALMKCYTVGFAIAVKNAIPVLRPKAVISVGTCSGLNPDKTRLGDVVVCAKLITCAPKMVTGSGEQSTGTISYVSRHFLDVIKYADHGWKAPLKDPKTRIVKVHYDGEFLSGPELISDKWRRDELAKSYPQATAIEEEGEGLFAAVVDFQIEWLIVKGIADYGDSAEFTSENWSPFASVMAASVVADILRDPVAFQRWPHYKDVSVEEEKAKFIKLEGSSDKEFVKWCQDMLREFYSTMSQVKITPWDPDNTVHVDDIYIPLSVLKVVRKVYGTTKEKLEDCSEMFEGEGEGFPKRSRILVCGRPGVGKSTFVKKIAVDWAKGEKEVLKKFDVLLLVQLRDVCDIPDFCTMLKIAGLLPADDEMAVSNLYQYVRENQEKVLLILDGYDEYSCDESSPVRQIWRGSQLRDLCVIITTKPVNEVEWLEMGSHGQYEINGFDSEEQIKQFASKFLPDEKDVEGLLEYLEVYELRALVEIPLLLLMMCIVWKEKDRQGLPTSRAYLHVYFIETLLEHRDNIFRRRGIDEYKEELSEVGKLAFDALLEDCFHFNFKKYPRGKPFEKFIDVGLFQVSKVSSLSPEKEIFFLHKSIQEFLAALFMVHELVNKKSETVTCLLRVDTLEKMSKMAEVLKFLCDLSSEAAKAVLCHLKYVGEKEGLTEYSFTKAPVIEDFSEDQKKFLSISLDCLLCCRDTEREALYPSFLSCVNHVVIMSRYQCSIAGMEHLLKSTGSFPNYLFLGELDVHTLNDEVLAIMHDLNVVVATSSGEVKAMKKYCNLYGNDFFLKKGGNNLFFYLTRIRKDLTKVMPTELLTELTAAESPCQTPVKNLPKIEDNSSSFCLTEDTSDQTRQNSLSWIQDIYVDDPTSEELFLLMSLLPFVNSSRIVSIKCIGSVAIDAQLKNSIVFRIRFTDNLHSLILRNMNLRAECAAVIAKSLHQAPNLHKLDLSENALYSGVSNLAENLRHVPRLTVLRLSNVSMGGTECTALAVSLQYVNSLQELDISGNPVSHRVIELVNNLNSVPNLRRLVLTNANIGEEEVPALASSLKYVPQLEHLELEDNPLAGGVSDLIQHLSSFSQLTWLDLYLSGVKMTKKESEELCIAAIGSNFAFYTDYHDYDFLQRRYRLRTNAELKEDKVEFRKGDEHADDDYSDDDHDDDEVKDDGEDESALEVTTI